MFKTIVTYDSGYLDINLDGIRYVARVKDESVEHKDKDWLCDWIQIVISKWVEGKSELKDGLRDKKSGEMWKMIDEANLRNAIYNGCGVKFPDPLRLSRHSKYLYAMSGLDLDDMILALDLIQAKYILPAPEHTVFVSIDGFVNKVVSFAYFKDNEINDDLLVLPVILRNGKHVLQRDRYIVYDTFANDVFGDIIINQTGIYSEVIPLAEAMDYYFTLKGTTGNNFSFSDYKAILEAFGVSVTENNENLLLI